jgi:hypothetical protein
LDIEVREDEDQDVEEAIREQLTAPKASMFAQALRQWACLFPQRSDIDGAEGDMDGIVTPIHAGRLESILEPDPESDGARESDGTGDHRFRMLARRRRNAGTFSPAFMQLAIHQ